MKWAKTSINEVWCGILSRYAPYCTNTEKIFGRKWGRKYLQNVKVSSEEIGTIYLLPGFLKSFKDENPRIMIALEINSSYSIVTKLVKTQIDVGFAVSINFPEFSTVLSKMKIIELMEIELVFIAPKNSPYLTEVMLDPRELIKMPYISRSKSSGVQAEIEKIPEASGISRKDLYEILKLKNSSSVINAVSEGL
ncbi:MAG: LysR substrate-binding domain-containing protein [Candidatus Parvarchaeota archaeon]